MEMMDVKLTNFLRTHKARFGNRGNLPLQLKRRCVRLQIKNDPKIKELIKMKKYFLGNFICDCTRLMKNHDPLCICQEICSIDFDKNGLFKRKIAKSEQSKCR